MALSTIIENATIVIMVLNEKTAVAQSCVCYFLLIPDKHLNFMTPFL